MQLICYSLTNKDSVIWKSSVACGGKAKHKSEDRDKVTCLVCLASTGNDGIALWQERYKNGS